jgi:P22 coat protein - gene protein 5
MQFNKSETVMFSDVFKEFNDRLIVSKQFGTFSVSGLEAERNNDTIWRTMPYIVNAFDGVDQTANFVSGYAQLSVPTSLGFSRSVPMTFGPRELRDPLQRTRLARAAVIRLSSDLNMRCSNLAAETGSIFVKRTGAATGFDDVAQVDAAMNRVGIDADQRFLNLSTQDYNNMASNLAARVLDNSKSLTAYDRAMVGTIAGFETFKLDYAYRLTAAAGVGVTVTAANQRYVPVSTVAAAGGLSNVDNRYQTISITVTSGTVKVGDAFQIAGVNEVHHITKQDTGSPKTFRINRIVTGAGGTGTVEISPPIIAADVAPTVPETQYKNCTATPAAAAPITFLNTAAGLVNPFWHADCFEIMPGKYEPDPDAGMAVMSDTTDQGLTVTMTKLGRIEDLTTRYRWDVLYGLVNKQPQMSGAIMFGQP